MHLYILSTLNNVNEKRELTRSLIEKHGLRRFEDYTNLHATATSVRQARNFQTDLVANGIPYTVIRENR